jgi:hypothetical protein
LPAPISPIFFRVGIAKILSGRFRARFYHTARGAEAWMTRCTASQRL